MTETAQAPTVSHALGEMTWLLSQSPIHRVMAIGDLEWLVMPALLAEQFYIFRDGSQPVGLALWAKTTEAGAAKLDKGMIEPENRLTLDEWQNGDNVWLVDLVAPFATAENKHREVMLADLIAGPLREKAFSFHVTDPLTGVRQVRRVEEDAFAQLKRAVEDAAA